MRSICIGMLLILCLTGSVRAAEPWSPGFDELPGSTQRMLVDYAKRCFFYNDSIWYADAEALAKRDANTKSIRGRSYIAGSRLLDYERDFEDGQVVPPVYYDLGSGKFVSKAREQMTAAQVAQSVAGEGPDLLTVTDEKEKVKRPTGEDVYALVAAGKKLPRFVAEKAVHDKAVYQIRTVGSGNSRIRKKVLVKPASYKAIWKFAEDRSSLAAGRAVAVLRRNREAAAKRLVLLETKLMESLRDDLTRTDDAERLIVLYVFEADEPDKADAFLPVVDEAFAAHAKLAQRSVDALTPDEALRLADWCYAMSKDERYRLVKAVKKRAGAAYARYLASDPAEGEAKTRATERAAELTE